MENNKEPDTDQDSRKSQKITFWHPIIAFSPIEASIIGIALIFVIVVMIVDRSLFDVILLGILFLLFLISILRARVWISTKNQLKLSNRISPKERRKKHATRRKDHK